MAQRRVRPPLCRLGRDARAPKEPGARRADDEARGGRRGSYSPVLRSPGRSLPQGNYRPNGRCSRPGSQRMEYPYLGRAVSVVSTKQEKVVTKQHFGGEREDSRSYSRAVRVQGGTTIYLAG